MFIYLALLSVLSCDLAYGAAKHPPTFPAHWVGKKVVALAPVSNVQVLLPDNSLHNFGEDFQARLTTLLTQSGKYSVIDELPLDVSQMHAEKSSSGVASPLEYVWVGSEMPSVTVRVTVEALTFQTGAQGDRMFYGFNERLRTPFNDGLGIPKNEFPLRLYSNQPSWFGDTFDRKGIEPFDSRAGLDLGEGVNFDFLYAFLNLKYAGYHADLHLRLELDSPITSINAANKPRTKNYELIEVKGDGFFFDLVGGYQNYVAGISLARRDAMHQAVRAAIKSSYAAIDRALENAPWLARVDATLKNGLVLMGTGAMSDILPGTFYQSVQYPDLVLKVNVSNSSGSLGEVVRGDPAILKVGMILEEMNSVPKGASILLDDSTGGLASSRGVSAPALVDSVQMPSSSFSPSNLKGIVALISHGAAFLKSLVGVVFLPYRLWRYFAYDQAYHSHADGGGPSSSDLAREPWRHQIGLDQVGPMAQPGPGLITPVVAVIDSGVDYNHNSIHNSLWLNPAPEVDVEGRKDRYGWDFISNDSKPYDDAYHGTQLASLVASIAPLAKILPLKIFNPWGITTSSAVYAAFQYAVDHGAQIILCGWATNLPTEAIEQGVDYARKHGVVVVAAAGDQGLNLSMFPMYPAVLSQKYDNILTVTDVDFKDRLVQIPTKKPNYDLSGNLIQLAAPGETLWVAEPRGGKSVETSTGLAAAVVAGVLARNIAGIPVENANYLDWTSQLLQEADQVDKLQGQVTKGRRLRVVR
ncbi:MAG: S8 family serine peptidase [Bdellovibrionia bacterium]